MRIFSILDNLNSSVQSFWVGADVVRNQRRDIHVKCNPGWFAGFNASNSLRCRVRADVLCAPSATRLLTKISFYQASFGQTNKRPLRHPQSASILNDPRSQSDCRAPKADDLTFLKSNGSCCAQFCSITQRETYY